jgi:type IV pilus assembly protein PilM
MLMNILSKWTPSKSPKKAIIGLDADEKSVKLIELKKSALGLNLVNYAIEEVVPSSPTEDRLASISATIKKVMSENSIEPGDIYTAISGPGVSIRRITVPQMPEEELYGAVRWEAKNLIPFPLDAVTLDYYIIGKVTEKGTEKLDIIVVAAQDEVINRQIKAIEGAGLKVSGVTANPFALWDILKKDISPKEEEVIALIDIGAEAASINLFKNNILQFTREISVAGDSITKSMTGVLISDQWQLSLTYEQAEKIKQEYGIPKEETQEKTPENIPLSQILEAMKPTLRRMLNEILRSFDYYKEQFREAKINKVFLAGGSSKLKNLEEYLSEGLGTKVEIVNSLQGMNINLIDRKRAERLRAEAPRLTLAMGLAIGETKSLNLIHVKKPTKKKFEAGKFMELLQVPSMIWAPVIMFVLIAAIAFNIYLGRKVHYYRGELEKKRTILADLKFLSERREIVNAIAKQESYLRETLSQLNTVIPSGILMTQLNYDNSSRNMKVVGLSPNTNAIGEFLKTLDYSTDFSNVKLIESRKSSGKDAKDMIFEMSFHVD